MVALRARTQAIARHLTEFLKKTDRFAKTIVFCVDQEHADEMRTALSNLNADLVRAIPRLRLPRHGGRGRHRARPPQPLSGRGHQDADDPDHLAAAHDRRRRADLQERRARARRRLDDRIQADHRPRHAGARRLRQALVQHPRLHRLGHAAVCRSRLSTAIPMRITEEEIAEDGETTVITDYARLARKPEPSWDAGDRPSRRPRSGGNSISTAARSRSPRISSTNSTRTASSCGWCATPITQRKPSARCARRRRELREQWADPAKRSEIIERLQERGIDFAELRDAADQPDADPFDLLCHLAFNAPLRTRRERAQQLRDGAQGLSSSDSARKRGRFSTSCSKNTPSTATPNLCCPMFSRFRRSQTTARSVTSSASSAVWISCAWP